MRDERLLLGDLPEPDVLRPLLLPLPVLRLLVFLTPLLRALDLRADFFALPLFRALVLRTDFFAPLPLPLLVLRLLVLRLLVLRLLVFLPPLLRALDLRVDFFALPLFRVLVLRADFFAPPRLRLPDVEALRDDEPFAPDRFAALRPPFLPPFLAGALLVFFPRPDPLFLPPPDILLTVAHARRSASFSPTPRPS